MNKIVVTIDKKDENTNLGVEGIVKNVMPRGKSNQKCRSDK